jgi:hypothetical protein
MAYSVTTDKTWSRILDDLQESFRKWGLVERGWRVEALLAPRSATKQNQDLQERTVTLHWRRRGKPYTITMNRQSRAVDNLLVIWLIVETLRLNDARGYAAEVAAVYRQEFPALPGPGQTGAAAPAPHPRDPYAALWLRSGAPLEVAEAAFRALAKTTHPDHGGDRAAWDRIQQAIEAIRKERGQ